MSRFDNEVRGSRSRLRVFLVLVVTAMASGCYQQMANQPRYQPLDESDFFGDMQSSRPLVPDTVARGEVRNDSLLFTGKVGNADAVVFPYPITRDIVERGRSRFDIFCAPCHGPLGYGNGMVVQRGFSPPPSFHQDRLRNAPVGHFFNVITNGFGSMPSYADQVPVRDRWAIISYVRALQLSQNGSYDDVPPKIRPTLGPRPAGTTTSAATVTPTVVTTLQAPTLLPAAGPTP